MSGTLPTRRRRFLQAACLGGLLLVALQTGCVRRRMTIRTDPPGAMVAVDQQEIGVTPLSVPFTYYGTRNFVVTKDSHETVMASRNFRPPWYQYPPLDFVTENLWPYEIRDERVVEFQLVPKANVSPEKLIGRAQDLRTSANNGLVAPLPTVTTGNPPPPSPNPAAVPQQSFFAPPPLAPSGSPANSPQGSVITPPRP